MFFASPCTHRLAAEAFSTCPSESIATLFTLPGTQEAGLWEALVGGQRVGEQSGYFDPLSAGCGGLFIY